MIKAIPMLFLQKCFFLLQSKSDPINGCLTTIMSTKNYSVTESVRNSCGQNTWRIVMQMAKNHLCIPSSAITSSRMSRNDVLPCISTGNLVSRLRSIGQEILQQSLIRIPVRSPKPIYLSAWWLIVSTHMWKHFWIWSRNHGLMPMFICTNILVVLPEFSYRITVKQQLSTMVALKTSRSMKLIRKWPNTTAPLLSRRVSGLQKISRMLRGQ